MEWAGIEPASGITYAFLQWAVIAPGLAPWVTRRYPSTPYFLLWALPPMLSRERLAGYGNTVLIAEDNKLVVFLTGTRNNRQTLPAGNLLLAFDAIEHVLVYPLF